MNVKNLNKEYILVFGFFLFVGFLYFNYVFNDPPGDYSFYAQIIEELKTSHLESNDLNLSAKLSAPIFYHYTDLFVGAIFSSLFGFKNLTCLLLIVYPLLTAASGTVLFDILRRNLTFLSSLNLTLSFFLISGVGLVLNYLEVIKFTQFYILNSPKLLPVLFGLLLFIREILVNNRLSSRLLVFTAFLYPPVLFVLSASMIITGTLLLLKPRMYGYIKAFLRDGLFLVIYYVIHYQLLFPGEKQELSLELYRLYKPDIFYFKKLTGDHIALLGGYVLPLFFLVLLSFSRLQELWKTENNFKLSSLLLFSGIFCSISWRFVSFNIPNSVQIQTNLFDPLLSLLLFLLLTSFYPTSKKIIPAFLFAVMLLNTGILFEQKISTNLMTRSNRKMQNRAYLILEREFSSINAFTSGYFGNQENMKKKFDFGLKNIYLTVPLPEIRKITNSYNPICLSVLELEDELISEESKLFNSLVTKSEYYTFAKANPGLSKDQLLRKFLKQRKLDFIFVEEGADTYVPIMECGFRKLTKIENVNIYQRI